ncbi:MAG: hypothetical protein IKO14_04865 [Oscillibacter sp.]|nr:hypothetical protein [Oscillibacter sp.]
MGMKNDFSFLFSAEINLFEHQSTWNPNMPLRDFIYLANLLEAYVQRKRLNLHGSRLLKFPTPHYIVLYNGEDDIPDRKTLRLSDAFEKPGGCAEMTAEVYNINYGRNAELMERCRPLRDYSILVEKIRRYRKSGLSVSEAVDRAVEECVLEDVLADFLRGHKAEVIGMLLTEYEQVEHMRLLKEEGIEEGRAEGIEQGVVHSMKSMMKTLGLSLEAALNALEIPSDKRQTYIDLFNRQGTPNV